MNTILDRREGSTLKAIAALLHRDSVCPQDGISFLDTLAENSHKHAFSVSEDLKYAVREAIELIGNEAVWYIRNVRKEGVFGTGEKASLEAKQLTEESLRYLYRLLFLFYIEARPELEYAPLDSDEYMKGYSLESLRDLEMIQLTTEKSKNGHYIHNSLTMLFGLVFKGHNPYAGDQALPKQGESLHHVFKISPLKSHLFNPRRTKIISGVKFRNHVLQRVLHLLSLSSERNSRGRGKQKRRGRISYAQLGINQLGAVYEGLLSYSGFFATTDLYEVKKAGETYNELENAYFVRAENLGDYTDQEKVYTENDKLVRHEKGKFIYRLAGRNRKKSASYYTPEVLTQCVVKYALKELLKDKTADEILHLTVCEPAMGSGAFLNEAINQLAEAYLKRKQKETGEIISHDAYTREKQKVKAYIASNNVFGVDLNPTAVELAEVSLWLNSIHAGSHVPWFGMQLKAGNSLIGARRQVFHTELLAKGRTGKPSWHDVAPERVSLNNAENSRKITSHSKKTVYHFLLPDKGMCNYKDKVIKQLAPEEMAHMSEWRKQFNQPFEDRHIDTLQTLSDVIDKLWQKHVDDLRLVANRTNDHLRVFGLESSKNNSPMTIQEKDEVYQKTFHLKGSENSSPFQRLKLIMDYWCALWFWPIEKAPLLPSREVFIEHLKVIVQGDVFNIAPRDGSQLLLDFDTETLKKEEIYRGQFGFVNVDKLCDEIEQLGIVRRLADRFHFQHWELVFADIFAERDGFDLVLGNPPWIKVEWSEGDVLSEVNPRFVFHKLSAAKLNRLRDEALGEQPHLKSTYYSEFEEADGTQNFLNAATNYDQLKGIQTNLYKCFLPQAWMIGSRVGVSGFLHPEGTYDDPKGGKFREAMYPRLRYHFQFDNELRLFSEVHHCTKFSVNIYNQPTTPCFNHIANLYSASTVGVCFDHPGLNPVEGIKDDNGNWNVNGHKDRIVRVDADALRLFARLYDEPGTLWQRARLPAIHATKILSVLKKFADQPRRLGDLKDEYFSTEMWHETNAQKDETIQRSTQFPDDASQWILSGPHFYVGNPFNKTPRRSCTLNSHYDPIDLTIIPDDYLPRTNYIPACDPQEYHRRTPKVPWDKKPVTDYYRFVNREMIGPSAERTLIPSFMPRHCGHINTCITQVFKDETNLLILYGMAISLPLDFRVKSTGMGHANVTLLSQLPLPKNRQIVPYLAFRALGLAGVTKHYDELWKSNALVFIRGDNWVKSDSRLKIDIFSGRSSSWSRNAVFRTDFERRQGADRDRCARLNGTQPNHRRTLLHLSYPIPSAPAKRE